MPKESVNLSKFAKNLKYCMNLYDENSSTLATLLNMGSSTIEKYITEKREPSASNLIKLAKHYNLPAEILFEGKCWGDEQLFINYENRHSMKELGKKAFPILEPSDEALNDKFFYRGYQAQLRFYSALAENGKFDKEDIQRCQSCYYDSIEANQTLEAVGNLLWLYIQIKYLNVHRERIKKMAEHGVFNGQKKVDMKFFVQNEILPSFYDLDDEYEKEIDELWEKDKAEIDMLCDKLIIYLKRHGQTSEYADFYVAIQYLYNLVNNGFEQSINCTIGSEILKKLYVLENKYAKEYIEVWTQCMNI